MSRVAQTQLSEKDIWVTPPELIDPIVEHCGGIDLDPCAGVHTGHGRVNWTIENRPADGGRKDTIYGIDALTKHWDSDVATTIFVNPPFGAKAQWVQKVLEQAKRRYQSTSSVGCIILLIPDNTDVRTWWHGTHPNEVAGQTWGDDKTPSYVVSSEDWWFGGVVDADWLWFSDGRLSYIDPETGEKAGSPTFGTSLALFGDPPKRLLDWLAKNGDLRALQRPF